MASTCCVVISPSARPVATGSCSATMRAFRTRRCASPPARGVLRVSQDRGESDPSISQARSRSHSPVRRRISASNRSRVSSSSTSRSDFEAPVQYERSSPASCGDAHPDLENRIDRCRRRSSHLSSIEHTFDTTRCLGQVKNHERSVRVDMSRCPEDRRVAAGYMSLTHVDYICKLHL